MRLVASRSILTAILLNAACGSSSPSAPTSAFLRKTTMADLAISGTATLLELGQTSPLTAKANSPQGVLTVTNNVTWTSADPAIATVSPLGILTAIGFGTTTVTARFDESEATQQVEVLAPTALTIGSTSPDGSILRSGVLTFTNVARTAQLSMTATWPGGITRIVTATTTWTSLDPAIASVTASGSLRSNAFGSTSIVAKFQTLTLSTPLDVAVVFSSLSIQGNLSLSAVGETSALNALARFSDGSSRQVASEVTWATSDASVVTVSPAGVLIAMGLGQASITATFQGHPVQSIASVTPAGTFVISGRARDPGNGQGQTLGVPGFAIRDLQTGRSTVTDATGQYRLVGVLAGDRLRFEKDGWETAEVLIVSATTDSSPGVQRVVRITAGDTAAITTAPNDLRYDLAPGLSCTPCRLVRVISPTAGTLHLRLTWIGSPSPRLSLFVGGQTFSSTTTAPIMTVADVVVPAGETVIFAGLLGGQPFATGYLDLTLTTSFTAAPIASIALNARPLQRE